MKLVKSRAGSVSSAVLVKYAIFLQSFDFDCTVINVKAGRCGAGLFPFNPEKILGCLPSIPPSTPSIMSTTPNIIETALLTSSPPDITVLESANDMLNDVINSVSPRVILLASAHISLASGF